MMACRASRVLPRAVLPKDIRQEVHGQIYTLEEVGGQRQADLLTHAVIQVSGDKSLNHILTIKIEEEFCNVGKPIRIGRCLDWGEGEEEFRVAGELIWQLGRQYHLQYRKT